MELVRTGSHVERVRTNLPAVVETGELMELLGLPHGVEGRSLVAFIDGIVTHHHAHARSELDRLSALAASLSAADYALAGVAMTVECFATLESELRAHMTKEEVVVFPYIAALEGALRFGRSLARSPFSVLQPALGVMLDEQDQTRSLLATMRRVTGDYTLPPSASPMVRAYYEGLDALEDALKEHGRLETEFLFPSALELERRVRR
jgi:regulator of cell morphogenesis and NO signaling